jgi:hypothetical protein
MFPEGTMTSENDRSIVLGVDQSHADSVGGGEDAEFRRRFEELKRRWNAETGGSSLLMPKFMHPAYQQIIGMGEPAIPILLEEVRRQSGHWFWALRAITGAEVAQGGDSYGVAADKWLRWGEKHGYI